MNSSETPPMSSATTSSSVISPSTSPFVANDEHLVDALLAHVVQQLIGRNAAVHPSERTQQRHQGRLRAIADEARDDVLRVEDADDVIRRARDRPAAGCRGW